MSKNRILYNTGYRRSGSMLLRVEPGVQSIGYGNNYEHLTNQPDSTLAETGKTLTSGYAFSNRKDIR